MNCKKQNCDNIANGMNGFCHECTEEGLNKLLSKLRAEPLAEEREEFGMLLMQHINTFTPEQLKRYNELKEILS